MYNERTYVIILSVRHFKSHLRNSAKMLIIQTIIYAIILYIHIHIYNNCIYIMGKYFNSLTEISNSC